MVSAIEFDLGGSVIFCAEALLRVGWFCRRRQSCLLASHGGQAGWSFVRHLHHCFSQVKSSPWGMTSCEGAMPCRGT